MDETHRVPSLNVRGRGRSGARAEGDAWTSQRRQRGGMRRTAIASLTLDVAMMSVGGECDEMRWTSVDGRVANF